MKKNYFLFLGLLTLLLMVGSTNSYGQLYINEFMASNDGSVPGPMGDNPDWIEIYNAGSEAVMLGGYYMSDNLTDPTLLFQIPSTYPDSVTVAAGGYIVFYANKEEAYSVLNLNFKLSGDGEAIGLWNSAMEVVDTLTFGPQTTDVSYGRYTDGTDNWFFMPNFTPGAANENPAPAAVELYINEFMASNDGAFPGPQGDYPDWIEIYNAGMEDVMLGGYYMSDDLMDPTKMFQIPSTYPDSVTVPAGGFLVLYANSDPEWSVLNLDFKLSGGGEAIGLWTPEQMFVDSLTYGEQIADTSYGRYTDGTDNWFFMPQISPGAANINPNPPADVDLYINEFMASNDAAFPGPQGDFPDWIEIYNAGLEDVMLGGYYLSDDLVDPEKLFQIPDTYPDSVTVPAGGFIVFYANSDPDWSVRNLNFKLSGGGEQIGLWNPDQMFVDSLTYGEQIADTSYGRYTDGTENWYMMPDFTPGEANRYVNSINEIVVVESNGYPNPFTYQLNIDFKLTETDQVTIRVYNTIGMLVAELQNSVLAAGNHQVKWDASNMPTGQYFYSIQTSKTITTQKVMKVK